MNLEITAAGGLRPERLAGNNSPRALREKVAEFEGILLSELLQKMSDCSKISGGDDPDSTSENFQSLATSALGSGLARTGGLGIGRMLVQSLGKESIERLPH